MGVAASGFNAKDICGTFIESARLFALAAEDNALHDAAREAAEMIISCLRSGGKLLLCGNGGSAADAQQPLSIRQARSKTGTTAVIHAGCARKYL